MGLREAMLRLDFGAVERALNPNVLEQLRSSIDDKVLRVLLSVSCRWDERTASKGAACEHEQILRLLADRMGQSWLRAALTGMRDSQGNSAAHLAVWSDCVQLFMYLHKLGVDVQKENSDGHLPLSIAVRKGNPLVVRFLLDMTDANRAKQAGVNRLHAAIGTLSVELVERTLRSLRKAAAANGVDADQPYRLDSRKNLLKLSDLDDDFRCALWWTKCSGPDASGERCDHTRMLDFIRSQLGAGDFELLLAKRSREGSTVVQYAVLTDCRVLLQYLLESGCEMDACDNDGDTPLHEAALGGRVQSVEFLLAQNCDVERRNKAGQTPFLQACRRCQFETAQLLSRHNAKVDAHDDCENTALHLLSGSERGTPSKEFFDWLVEKMRECGIDDPMKLHNLSQHTPLLVLADSGNLIGFAPHLGNFSASSFSNLDGLNILHVWAARHSLARLRIKLSKNVDWKSLALARVKKGFYEGFTCLHFACRFGHLENIKLLITDHPNMLQETSKNSGTPLELLVRHKHENLLKSLQEVTNLDAIVEGVDDVMKALTLPTVQQAQQTLLPFCNPELKIVIMKRLHREETYVSGSQLNAGKDGLHFPSSVRLFYEAMKEDSSEMFRSILALGFWKHLKSAEVPQSFCRLVKNAAEKANHQNPAICHALPVLHHSFQSFLERPVVDSVSKCFNLSSPSLLGIAVRTGRFSIAKDLVLIEQIHLIPTCSVVIDECCRQKALGTSAVEPWENLRQFCSNLLLNALDAMGNQSEVSLLHSYLADNFSVEGSPLRFTLLSGKKRRSVIELLIRQDDNEVLASDCVAEFADAEWKRSRPSASGRTRMSPQKKLLLHSTAFLVFMALLAYFVCFLERRTSWIDFAMIAFTVSFAIQEVANVGEAIRQPTRHKFGIFKARQKKLYIAMKYLLNGWNWVNLLGIVSLTAGLAWKLGRADPTLFTPQEFYFIRILLSLSFSLWCLRTLYFLRLFGRVGPFVNMLKTLLNRDLLPFMVLFFIVCLAFGVLFFNLLLPDSRNLSKALQSARDRTSLLSVYTRPLMLAFGHLEVDELSDCSNLAKFWSDSGNESVSSRDACTHPAGTFLYIKFFIFLFLFLVNLTLLNMLIAKFSLTVSQKEDKAYMIWRGYKVKILRDYQAAMTLPPPLTLLHLPLIAFDTVSCRSKTRPDQRTGCFEDFLLFQACTFMNRRRQFALQRVDSHLSTMAKLAAEVASLREIVSNLEAGVRLSVVQRPSEEPS